MKYKDREDWQKNQIFTCEIAEINWLHRIKEFQEGSIKILIDKNESVLSENDKLRKALEFYADDYRWETAFYDEDTGRQDDGEVAKAALELK